jgi:hypothetical protein
MTEMVTSGSMSGAKKRSDGPLGESASERVPLVLGAAGPGRHRASPRLYRNTVSKRTSTLAGSNACSNSDEQRLWDICAVPRVSLACVAGVLTTQVPGLKIASGARVSSVRRPS